MSKQQTCQRYIFKINSKRLRDAKWDLTLTLPQARKNQELVSLSDSQMLRFIDSLNNIEDADAIAKGIQKQIKRLRKEPDLAVNRHKIKKLYEKLDEIQHKPDYMCLIIDREKDYWRACKGFTINNVKYVRLLGTTGGVKNSTIVFVSERLYPELKRRIDNGRNMEKEMVPAKLEAYQALTCSGSIPVSFPKGIAVVDDCFTHFKADVVNIADGEPGQEPKMWFEENADVEVADSDGYGLMLPSLAERWSEELKLGYTACGMNTRFAWEKGMVFAFDFLDFADNVAGTRIIKDAWGNTVDLSDVELILPVSMVKLWDSYDSCDDYIWNSVSNGYTFGIPKTTPEVLESEHALNYQFIQSYELSDEDIDELIAPTVEDIKGVLSLEWWKTVLFLQGIGLTEDNVCELDGNIAKAIMVDPSILNDNFIRKKVMGLIKKRIDQAKIGVLNVHGNYSIISGDPYAFCQSIFGLPVTGILKAGEIYNKYWLDAGTDKLACFRAPMSCHENIRKVTVNKSEEAQYWFRYMNTCTALNAWDTATHALNGADKDGDLVMLTDNRVLVDNLRDLPTIMCAQRKATKCIPTEEDMIQANINSFGDDIGKVTNRITSMYDVMSQFDPDSDEYKTLEFRIKCGQLLQQNCIDKAKGIISEPMPKYWYDRHAIKGDDEVAEFNRRIVADKKPYFMKYIYPNLMKEYKTHIDTTSKKCMMTMGYSIDQLLSKPLDELTDEEREFVKYYNIGMPVSTGDSVMNRICKKIEKEFSGYIGRNTSKDGFDYSALKGGYEYSANAKRQIKELYEEYIQRSKEYLNMANRVRIVYENKYGRRLLMMREFWEQTQIACSNSGELVDIIVDVCYKKDWSKQFVWDMVGNEVIENLLNKNGRMLSYPELDPNGELAYGGHKFTIKTKKVEEYKEDECDFE